MREDADRRLDAQPRKAQHLAPAQGRQVLTDLDRRAVRCHDGVGRHGDLTVGASQGWNATSPAAWKVRSAERKVFSISMVRNKSLWVVALAFKNTQVKH